MLLPVCSVALGFLSAVAHANTEKTIFVAPERIHLGDVRPNLVDLQLDTLTTAKRELQTALPVAFATNISRGIQSWYLLDNLDPGQRYEVRICWPATQPTQFWLETHEISHVFETPSLLENLATYSYQRQEAISGEDLSGPVQDSSGLRSALFLELWSSADFYSANQDLMKAPPPVEVDIILDPFLLNVFPKSLLPTAAYVLTVALGGWYISGLAWKQLQRLLEKDHQD